MEFVTPAFCVECREAVPNVKLTRVSIRQGEGAPWGTPIYLCDACRKAHKGNYKRMKRKSAEGGRR